METNTKKTKMKKQNSGRVEVCMERRSSEDDLKFEGHKEADSFSNRLSSKYQDRTKDASIPDEISMSAQNLLPDTTMTVTETDTDDDKKSKLMQQREKEFTSIPLNIYSSVPDKYGLHYQFKRKYFASEVKQDKTTLTPQTQLWDVSAGSNSDSFPYVETTKSDTLSAMEEDRRWSTKMEPVFNMVPLPPSPGCSSSRFPPTQAWDLSARSKSDSSHHERLIERLKKMEIKNKRKQCEQLMVRGKKIKVRRRQKLRIDENRSDHPLVTSPSTASLDTLPSDSSLYEISNIITNSLKLTTPHLSEPQNKAILTKEAKDMSFGWTANPAASSSLSQDTTREIRNSTPAAATRSSQVKLQNSFDSREQDNFKPSVQSSSLEEIKESAGLLNYLFPIRSVRTDLPYASASESGLRRRDRSHSSPCLWSLIPQDPLADVSILPRAASLPDMKLQSSFEEFTPDFTGDEGDEDDETYWLRCSSPGLYQCRVSGLVFDMKGEGDVSYRIVPWSSRLLSKHGKKPAGPLFDISCEQQSVVQLHLPHCEIPSGGCTYLSVAHVDDHGIEFIKPEEITETHVIINITGFSAFGVVKDEDSPPDRVRALVLLFYKPPAAPSVRYQINVLLLPKNVALRHVLRFRKKIDKDEKFLETPPHCRLQPKRLYTLSTRPGRQSVLVQPKEAEFDAEVIRQLPPNVPGGL